VISELNLFTTGWVTYFRLAECKSRPRDLDEWVRRKLRCYRLKQLKRRGAMIRYFVAQGVRRESAVPMASSGKGWWRLAVTPAVHMAMNNTRLAKAGLRRLTDRYLMLRGNETAGCDIARPVV
jgi:hypothetical protein